MVTLFMTDVHTMYNNFKHKSHSESRDIDENDIVQ